MRDAARMGLHHIAIAAKDIDATHRFYTEVMGFELAKVEAAPTPEGGWAKHLFYDTGGGGMIAFWDLHDDAIGDDWNPAISKGLGLPEWVNHVSFAADSLDDLETRKQRMLDAGETVSEIDHGWCRSIYAVDPNGVLVEFCVNTRPLDESDREEALARLRDDDPELDPVPEVRFHEPSSA